MACHGGVFFLNLHGSLPLLRGTVRLKTAMGQPLVIPPAGEDTAHLAGTSSTPASASTLAADGSGEQLNLTYSSLIPIKAIVILITASLSKTELYSWG